MSFCLFLWIVTKNFEFFLFGDSALCTGKTIEFPKFCYNTVAKICTWFFFFVWMNLNILQLSLLKLSVTMKLTTTTSTAKPSAVNLSLSNFETTSQIYPYLDNQPLKVRISISMSSDENIKFKLFVSLSINSMLYIGQRGAFDYRM